MEADNTAGLPVDKIWTIGGLLLGYSGDLSVREKIRAVIEKGLAEAPLPVPTDAEMAMSQLQALIRPVLAEVYANFVGGPNDDPVAKLGGSLIAVGRDQEKYWLLEIDENATATHYTDDGFHTIGSASVASHMGRRLLSHYSLPGYETQHLCLLAMRTVDASIDVLGRVYSIDGPVQLWQSTDDGFEAVVGEAFEAVKEGLAQWHQIERESLSKVFATSAEEAEEGLPAALPQEDEPSAK